MTDRGAEVGEERDAVTDRGEVVGEERVWVKRADTGGTPEILGLSTI